ncbi:MAG: DUF6714 family protein [Anaerolineae bacterium]
MIDETYNELASEITIAFEPIPYPGDDPKVVGNWWELSNFLGKKWKEVSLEDVNTNWGPHHFTPKGLAYYLPAYLIAILLHPEQVDKLAREAVLKVLSPTKGEDGKIHKLPFSNELTSNQIKCIHRFVEAFGQIYPVWIKEWDYQEILQKGLEYWQHMDDSI